MQKKKKKGMPAKVYILFYKIVYKLNALWNRFNQYCTW